MAEPIHHEQNKKIPGSYLAGFTSFDNLADFAKAVEAETGQALDAQDVIGLDTDFVQASGGYMLLNVKEYGTEPLDHLLFLTEHKSYVLSKKDISSELENNFADILPRSLGLSTAIAFFTLDKVLDSHKLRLESLIRRIKQLEEEFSHGEYLNLSLEFERLDDRLEEFHDLLLKLQERSYWLVDTHLIAFDYDVLLAESLSLQGRCRRRLESLRVLRQEYESRATEELNERIVRLNDVVKRLTALTVILMLPTLIASHFGMNFAFMPELKIWWAYPAVIVSQIVIVGIGFVVFRKIGWL